MKNTEKVNTLIEELIGTRDKQYALRLKTEIQDIIIKYDISDVVNEVITWSKATDHFIENINIHILHLDKDVVSILDVLRTLEDSKR